VRSYVNAGVTHIDVRSYVNAGVTHIDVASGRMHRDSAGLIERGAGD
jgi:hypothetical protein